MKKLWMLAANYVLTFCIAALCAACLWFIRLLVYGGRLSAPQEYMYMLTASVPAAILIAAYRLFFILNKRLSSRLVGWLILWVLGIILLAAAALPLRYKLISEKAVPESLPAAYRGTGQWLGAVSAAPSHECYISIAAFAFFSGSFWGLTRISRTRPLIGAFCSIAGLTAALYVLSIYYSGIAGTLFSFLGISITKQLSSAVMIAVTGAVLCLLDILLARKPSGE